MSKPKLRFSIDSIVGCDPGVPHNYPSHAPVGDNEEEGSEDEISVDDQDSKDDDARCGGYERAGYVPRPPEMDPSSQPRHMESSPEPHLYLGASAAANLITEANRRLEYQLSNMGTNAHGYPYLPGPLGGNYSSPGQMARDINYQNYQNAAAFRYFGSLPGLVSSPQYQHPIESEPKLGHFPLQPTFSGLFSPYLFRKPKRIRTAFSPAQLLKLEHAFEKNQYVVGTERKQLAQTLNLSETQVKVWFQNRRTKQKRQKTEDEEEEEEEKGEGEEKIKTKPKDP